MMLACTCAPVRVPAIIWEDLEHVKLKALTRDPPCDSLEQVYGSASQGSQYSLTVELVDPSVQLDATEQNALQSIYHL